jgi:hypothetical protein
VGLVAGLSALDIIGGTQGSAIYVKNSSTATTQILTMQHYVNDSISRSKISLTERRTVPGIYIGFVLFHNNYKQHSNHQQESYHCPSNRTSNYCDFSKVTQPKKGLLFWKKKKPNTFAVFMATLPRSQQFSRRQKPLFVTDFIRHLSLFNKH